ncbi:MAG: elongation factor Ts [Candidatus Paceibacterota bacterium]
MVTTDIVKQLREETGVSVMQCKKALEEAGGDVGKARVILSKKGAEAAAKKADRNLGAGRIAAYVHGVGTVGSMIELASETDFVSKHPDFYTLAYEIAMQIAATNPTFIKKEDVVEADRAKAREVFVEEAKDKPEAMREKIVTGKLDAYFKDKILLEQSFIKNPDITIKALIESAIQKFGEKIEIVRFVRYGVGQK